MVPGTPAGVIVDPATGCPLRVDTDHDGVLDGQDRCPYSPPGEPVDAFGCAASQVDSDGDGVPDVVDGCPQDPKKVVPGQCGCGQLETVGCGHPASLRITTNPAIPAGEPAPQMCSVGTTLDVPVYAVKLVSLFRAGFQVATGRGGCTMPAPGQGVESHKGISEVLDTALLPQGHSQ